jgi:TnpA family transposase
MFSSAEREAAYVLDGLTYGDGSFFDGQVIHSTDTHGYTESIFGTSWMLGFNFAPRIKNLKKQRIYAFEPKKTYKDMD